MKDEKILEKARKDYQNALDSDADNRATSLRCSQFVDGKQWPEELKAQREREKRPCLTINKLRKYVNQVAGDIQQHPISMEVRPADSIADGAGAELRNDILKYIEFISDASEAYDTAVQQALEGAFGYWRITKRYCDETSFDQDIIITPVPNRFSVLLDPTGIKKNYEDAKYGFVISTMDKDEFLKEYPDKAMADFETPPGVDTGWYAGENVTVAEYFWKEFKHSSAHELENGLVIDGDTLEDMRESGEFPNIDQMIVQSRKVSTPHIKQVKMSYNSILEGPNDFPGEYIPIIKVIGYEHNDEGKRKFRSLGYDAMDSVRMLNYWKTYSTEMIALAPKVPYKLTPQQIEGHKRAWNAANITPFPYLLYNPDPAAKAPMREPQVPIPAAAVNESKMAADDIQDSIGLYAPSLGEPSNERSGRAILLRQRQASNTIFAFIKNFQNAVKFSSKVILRMMPDIYDNHRIFKVFGEDEIKEIAINYKIKDPETLAESVQNDLSKGKYDMIPTVGPNYATKRMETAASMLDFLQFVPAAAPVIAPKLAKLMDWEGAQTIGDEIGQLFGGANSQQQGSAKQTQPMPDNVTM